MRLPPYQLLAYKEATYVTSFYPLLSSLKEGHLRIFWGPIAWDWLSVVRKFFSANDLRHLLGLTGLK